MKVVLTQQRFLGDVSDSDTTMGLTGVKWMCTSTSPPRTSDSGDPQATLWWTADRNPYPDHLTEMTMSKGIQESLRMFFCERFLLRQEGPLSTVITAAVCIHARRRGRESRHSPQGTAEINGQGRLETAWKSLTVGVFFKEKVNSQQQ